MSAELPKIISDDEFARLLSEREHVVRSGHDRWDNSALISSHQPSDGLPESSIEQSFPRIAEKLVLAWPSEACAMYIASLIVNKREARQGFPKEVVEDLLMLHAINDMLVRNLKPRTATNSTQYARTPPRTPR